VPEITVQELLREKGAELTLEAVAGREGLGRVIRVSEVNRPGLALAGYFEYFRGERIQIFGMGESAYMDTLSNARRMEVLEQFFSARTLPCAITTHGRTPPLEMVEQANRHSTPLITCPMATGILIEELAAYLEESLAPLTTLHGVLVDVYGLGVLIVGVSGIGKSECALELLKRGHILVADDVVEIKHKPGAILVGHCNPLLKHHMEVRGLGIIDVTKIFGVSSVIEQSKIELVVRLEADDKTQDYERVGLEQRSTEILGVKVPEAVIPVRPGRNVAILV
jgi:HPr kinase/phosphorylase